VIFPFGGENTPDLVLPSQRLFGLPPERLRPPAPGVLPVTPVCIDRSGVGRDRHAWDKDSRCVFCDRRRISKWRS
jgi:hypothetical protein